MGVSHEIQNHQSNYIMRVYVYVYYIILMYPEENKECI